MKISIVALGIAVSTSLVAARTKISKDDSSSSVQKKEGKTGADIVDIRFNSGLKPEQITDEHLDYLEFAMQYAFDETNPNGMYKSTGVKIQVLKPDDDGNNNKQELQGGSEPLEWTSRWYASAMNQRGCQFCPTDDAFLSDSDNMLNNQKTLTKWAKAVCDSLQESSLEGFKDANGCKISLPYGGVGGAAPAEDEAAVSLIPKKSTRVVHSGKKKEDDPMEGEDAVDVHFSMDIDAEDVTDSHLEYLALAMQMTFDETNRAHMYKSKAVHVNFMEEEDGNRNTKTKEGVLRGAAAPELGGAYSRWWASAFNQRGCQFCPTDDAFLSENPLGNEKTLKNWARSLCDALNDSPLDGFKNAKGCVIELPQGGVGTSKSDAAITSVA